MEYKTLNMECEILDVAHGTWGKNVGKRDVKRELWNVGYIRNLILS